MKTRVAWFLIGVAISWLTFFVVTALVAFLCWFIHNAYMGFTRVETGEKVPSVDWLPDAASNVSYYKSYRFTSYEFDISESDFIEWSRWELSPIDEPFWVARYCYFSARDTPEPGPNATDAEMRELIEERDSGEVIVTDGLYYLYEQSNGGGVWVAYDRKRARGYFHSSPR